MKRRYAKFLGFVAAGLVAVVGGVAQADGPGALGWIDPGERSVGAEWTLGVVAPRRVWRNAAVASAGVGLRNRASGAIELSDVQAPVRRAFIYWTVNYHGTTAPQGAELITVQRVAPTRSGARELVGEEIATGEGPCWGPPTIGVFRATVPNRIVDGNGTYLIKLPEGVPGVTDGSNPWGNAVPPLYNGASLVVVGTGLQTVALYEAPLSGSTMIGGSLSYTLRLPPAIANGVGPAQFHQIGSDGQEGAGRGDASPVAVGETVLINATLISGPGSVVGDSDWNGSSGGPIAQLWDNRMREIGVLLSPGQRRVPVEIRSEGDCITPVANILAR